ncbi:hypothetical protein BaRGS_00038004, partial [Batillaria attramentaria]
SQAVRSIGQMAVVLSLGRLKVPYGATNEIAAPIHHVTPVETILWSLCGLLSAGKAGKAGIGFVLLPNQSSLRDREQPVEEIRWTLALLG